MGSLRYIKDLLLKNKYKYLLGIAFLICVDLLQLVLPVMLGRITDQLETGALTRSMLVVYAIALTAISLGMAVFRFLYRYTVFGVSRSIELSFRNRFYAHLQKLSVNYFNSHKTGDLMAHATNDINNVTTAAGQGIVFAIDSLMIPIVAIAMMWSTAGFRLTLASSSPLLLLSVTVVFFMKIMQNTVRKQQEAFSNLTETARENFSGIRVIKAFVQEKKEIEKFERANSENKKANLKFVRLMNLMFPSVMTISSFSFVIALWYGGSLVINGSLSLGGFVAFNTYLGMLIWPVTAIGWIANIFQRGSVSLRRINVILDEKPEIEDESTDSAADAAVGPRECGREDAPAGNMTGSPRESGGIRDAAGSKESERAPGGGPSEPGKIPAAGPPETAVEFRGLTFSYPGAAAPALENIGVSIGKGKTLAIVGRTGSGKTTLISLIPRLLSVPPGSLFIDGRDINSLPLSELRSSIGCVPQDTFLFSATIRENIDFYRGFSMDEIIWASKVARIYDNIDDFPDKFSTLVGERGVTLSGGQKQRIAIARAVLGSPSILILDDCLSAVDANTEAEILKDLKGIMKQRTSIIISHRVSAVKDADGIIVLEGGKITQSGSHEALLKQDGYYAELYRKQLLAEQIEEA